MEKVSFRNKTKKNASNNCSLVKSRENLICSLICREFLKHVSTADDCRSFPDFFRSLVTAWKLKEVIAVDNVRYVSEDRDKLINILSEHIFHNIVRIGNKYYQQKRGKWDIGDIKQSRNFSFQHFFAN